MKVEMFPATRAEGPASIVPTMRYRDAPAAIEWLCRAFGFERQMVVTDPTGIVAHAQLVFGNGMIMLGTAQGGEFGRHIKQPQDIDRCETQSAYIIVPDADAHYARAKAAGAEILIDIKDESYGGRGYTCRDLEDHIWNFGTYDPWTT
jgi:uncharacterized glyoxalase superfamily protein PhnB